MKKRLQYYDSLRGLAIIGVVAIHSTSIAYTYNFYSLGFIGTALWRQVINFSVPLFIALSGYFISQKKTESKKDYLNFLIKHIPHILFPYFVWSLVYLAPLTLNGGSLKEIAYLFFTFQSTGPFYFIFLILQFYFLLPVIKKMATRKGLWWAGAVSIGSTLIISCLRYQFQLDLPLIMYAGLSPLWLVFFVLGIYFYRNKVNFNKFAIYLTIGLGLALSVFETFFIYFKYNNIEDAVTTVKASSFLFSIALITYLFAQANKNKIGNKLLSYLGQISFGIYLSHMLMIWLAVRSLNFFLHNYYVHTLVYQALLVILTLTYCTLFNIYSKKLNQRLSTTYLGQ